MALALLHTSPREIGEGLGSTLDHRSGMLRAMSRVTRSFVGRSRQLEEISSSLDDARAGHGGLWLVSGEPGIGKSRLTEEVARIAADRDVRVVWGRCWEAGGAPAFWPWIQLLRSVLRDDHAAEAELIDAVTNALGRKHAALVAELSELLPELRDPTLGRGSRPELEPEQARFRLMDAVTRTLIELARRRPLLILLEDLHTADPSSLLLLELLVGQIRGARLLVLGTYRSAEAQRSVVGDGLRRLASAHMHVSLDRLTRDEVGTLLDHALDVSLPPEWIDAVFAATEGNPLFVGELARLHARSPLSASHEALPIPTGIRNTLRARLMTLSESTRRVLSIAAVIGRESRVALLQALAQDSGQVHAAIDESIDSEVLIEHGPGALRFSHIMLQQVLYGELSVEERATWHRRVAEQLALSHDSASVSERAHHLLQAGDDVAALAAHAATAAAEQASAQHALHEAVTWYAHAFAALQRAPHSPTERCDLLLALAHAQIVAHEIDAGRAQCEQAAALARQLGDAARFANAALAYGAVFVIAEVNPKLVCLLQDALELLPAGDHPLRARVMARLAAAQQPAADPHPPVQMARDAIAMARRIGDSRVLMWTLRAGCSAMMDMTDPRECTPLHLEHSLLAQQLDDKVEYFVANLRLVFSAYAIGDVLTARAAIAACAHVAIELNQPHYQWRVEAMNALLAIWEGRFLQAETFMERARELGERASDPNAVRTSISQRVLLLRLQGRFVEMRHELSNLSPALKPSLGNLPAVALYTAAELARSGARDQAFALLHGLPLADALSRVSVLDDATMFDSLVELLIARDDKPTLRAHYERALPRCDQLITGGVFGFTWDVPMQRGLGRIAAYLDRLDEASRHYETALAQLRGIGARPFLAWTALEAADVARRSGDVLRERALREEAERLARELSIRLPDEIPEPEAAIGGASSTVADPGVPRVGYFHMQREGDVWSLDRGANTVRIKDGKGVAMLARLVEAAGNELHVLDLVSSEGVIDRGDSGEVLDRDARAQYQTRLRELRSDLEEAEQHADLGRAERAQHEIDAITQELSRGFGLGGKARRAGSATERARVNVQRRLRDAITKIAALDHELGRHLEWAIKTGTFCSYRGHD